MENSLFKILLGDVEMKDVAAGIIFNEGKILIAKRGKGQKSEGKWEFPGGKIEPIETPEQAVRRELMEELSLEVQIGDFFMESTYKYNYGVIRLHAYKAECKTGNVKLSVHSEVKWVDASDILGYDFAEADIPIAEKIKEMKASK